MTQGNANPNTGSIVMVAQDHPSWMKSGIGSERAATID